MFNVNDRNSLREKILRMAAKDSRVVAGAVVGSLALEEGDRWSDLDLTFSVADQYQVSDVLEDWTKVIIEQLGAAHLFDLPSGASIYRVFLMPGCLQFDLSFTPAEKFGASGPKFRLLFGSAKEKTFFSSPAAQELFGYAVHHLVRARFCIERERYWQAEYWISSARDYALNLSCLQLGLPPNHGRGFDQLPKEVLGQFEDSLIGSFSRHELIRALSVVINGLLAATGETMELISTVGAQLRELTVEWD